MDKVLLKQMGRVEDAVKKVSHLRSEAAVSMTGGYYGLQDEFGVMIGC